MSKTRRLAFCLALWAGGLVIAGAQAPAPQTGTARLAGQVKVGEKGLAGAIVSVSGTGGQRNLPFAANAGGQAVTDAEGRFEIANVAAGPFRLTVSAPGYVLNGGEATGQVGEGQAVDNLAFTLVRGGVITGRVTSSSGRPVIGEPVMLQPATATAGQPGQPGRPPGGTIFRTDDRGIYRIFGLAAGQYIVSVGRGDGGRGATMWQRTFYPEALVREEATAVPVEAGQEVTGIDIRISARATYAISGRVVDAEGNPLPGLLIGHAQTANGRGNRGAPGPPAIDEPAGATSNGTGEFRIEGLSAGAYSVYVARDRAAGGSEYYSEPVPVEISGADATDVEIRMLRGASVAGLLVFENPNDPNVQANMRNLMIRASSRSNTQGGGRGGGGGGANEATAQPEATGAFRLTGLAPGLVTLTLVDRGARGGGGSGLTLLRIEREGADLQAGLRVNAGEQVGGVRIVATYGNSSIRGLVRVEGGALPGQMRLMISARRIDAGAGVRDRGGRNAMVDPNGRFQIDQLVGGTYELSLQMPGMGRNAVEPVTVTVGNGGVQEVVVPLNLATLNAQPRPNNGGGGRQRGGRP